MRFGAEILSGLVVFLLVWLGHELLRHRRALARIPVRVHVNGTRGKSSVTRLIAAGLRAGGKRVVAKTTGTLARVILPNARELGVFRPLGANVREQIRIVRFAAEQRAEVLVVECMALQPILQWLSEKMFVRATHGVITNARPDHLDVMGPTGDDVAKALCGMMPRRAVCFTAEGARLPILAHAAEDRGTRLDVTEASHVETLRDEEMAGFAHYEHRENVALALRVCAELGVDRETALAGMCGAQPDPGALTFHEIDFFGREIVFVNAFAANDPISSRQIWELCRERYPAHRSICVFNCRADRVERSRQLGEALADWPSPDRVMAVGTGTVFFGRATAAAGFDVARLVSVEGADAREVFERLVEVCGRRTVLVGLGNIGGLGLDLVRLFRNRALDAPALREEAR
ncbi:MAG TPA: poly-gamma-glutamate synthase PgsB [Sandaracinaceae bacterium LLY-WYZ-13_1]|nr:poly-gamma-glutamate synthase PgsB [Sandaracinaceae bacterium LLY-WYZ-13_1]